MDISATPQHPRNKTGEFHLKYGKLKATEKRNLQCKALDSLTKVIFALIVFNSSYFIIYFQKAFNTCVAIKIQTFARLKFVVIKRPKESDWGEKMQNAKHQLLQGPSGQIRRLICEMHSALEGTVSRALAAAEELNRAA